MSTFRYRKRPIVVEAHRMMLYKDQAHWPTWLREARERGPGIGGFWPDAYGNYVIGTLEGKMLVKWGDWIVRGVQGELYSVRDSIFQATYEEVVARGVDE